MINVYRTNTRNSKQLTMIILSLVLTFLILIALMIVSSIGTFSNATKTANFTYERITVQKGDTLWGLASKVNDSIDTSTLVNKTIKYNNLSSTYIQPGQIIYVPVGL